jgi:PAS domain-containing protein
VQQGVRTLAVAVDRELAASTRELTRLAQYPTLTEANLRSFHAYARELVAAHDGWTDLTLIDADGRELMAARSPLDSAPRLLDRAHHKEVFRTGQPALSDIFADARTAELSISLAVPVVRDGQVRWALAARFEPAVLARLLASQDVRPNMVAAIMDRNKLIVARNTLHDRFFGKSATADLQEASRVGTKGTAILTTLDNVRAFAAWEQVPMGWTLTVGIPQSQIDGPIRRQLGWLAIGGLLLMLAALGVSLTLGRRLERGLASAINDAQKLADGRPPPLRRSRVRELEALFAALRATHARLTAAADAESQATASVRESEERLRLAMDSVTMGSFDWSPASDQLISTARMRELFGFARDEQPI